MAAARSKKPAANQRNPRIPLNWLSDSDTQKSSCVDCGCVNKGVSGVAAGGAGHDFPVWSYTPIVSLLQRRRNRLHTEVSIGRRLGEGRVYEGLLGLKGSRGATAWLAVIVESRVHYLRK
jgi:hypothetical protein